LILGAEICGFPAFFWCSWHICMAGALFCGV